MQHVIVFGMFFGGILLVFCWHLVHWYFVSELRFIAKLKFFTNITYEHAPSLQKFAERLKNNILGPSIASIED